MMNKSESQIQAEIMLALSNAGHRVWRSNAGSVRNEQGHVIKLFPKGFSDLTGHRASDGKAIYIEVKNKNGKLSRDQKKFRDAMIKRPVIYGVARSAKEALDIIENEAKYYE